MKLLSPFTKSILLILMLVFFASTPSLAQSSIGIQLGASTLRESDDYKSAILYGLSYEALNQQGLGFFAGISYLEHASKSNASPIKLVPIELSATFVPFTKMVVSPYFGFGIDYTFISSAFKSPKIGSHFIFGIKNRLNPMTNLDIRYKRHILDTEESLDLDRDVINIGLSFKLSSPKRPIKKRPKLHNAPKKAPPPPMFRNKRPYKKRPIRP